MNGLRVSAVALPRVMRIAAAVVRGSGIGMMAIVCVAVARVIAQDHRPSRDPAAARSLVPASTPPAVGASTAAAAAALKKDAAPDDEEVRAVAALFVNGESRGETTVVWRDGLVWVPATALRDAGVMLADARPRVAAIDGTPHVAVDTLGAMLRAEWDEQDVALRLTASPDVLSSQIIDLNPQRPHGLTRIRPMSGFLNYALAADSRSRGIGTALETGFSLRNLLLRTVVSRDVQGRWLRGATSLVVDDERRLQRWEAGDTVIAGGAIGGAVPVLGLMLSRELGIDPYFLRYEPLTLSGAVTTPSTADVYVNGQLVAREQIAPGRFSLQGLQAQVGAGRTDVVLRDAFGREQRVSSAFYQAATLLRRGLHQYRYGAGIRQAPPREDDRRARFALGSYRGVAAVGEHRVGLRDWLTIGGRVEGSDRVIGAAPDIALRAPIGELSATVAASRRRLDVVAASLAGDVVLPDVVRDVVGDVAVLADSRVLPTIEAPIEVALDPVRLDDGGRRGAAFAGGWSYRARQATLGVSMRGATKGYRSIDSAADVVSTLPAEAIAGASEGVGAERRVPVAVRVTAPRLRRDLLAYAGVSLPRGISLSAQHSEGRDWSGGRSRRSVVSSSWPVARWGSMAISVARGRVDRAAVSWDAFVGLNVRLGMRSAVDVGWNREPTIAYQRSLPIGPGVGGRLQYQPESQAVDARVQAQGTAGRVELRHVTIGQAPSTSVNLAGGLVAIGGRLHATRPVDDAYGLVRVPGVKGVRTYLSNQFVGRTNGGGDLVVPGLVSYYGNRLSIDPEDLPFDRELGASERIVAPAWRGGALARFDAPRVQAITGRLVMQVGERRFVPAFGELSIDVVLRARVSSPIDTDGTFYLEAPSFDPLGTGAYRMTVTHRGVVYACTLVVETDRARASDRDRRARGAGDDPQDPQDAQEPAIPPAIDLGIVVCRDQPVRTADAGARP